MDTPKGNILKKKTKLKRTYRIVFSYLQFEEKLFSSAWMGFIQFNVNNVVRFKSIEFRKIKTLTTYDHQCKYRYCNVCLPEMEKKKQIKL